MPRAAAALRMRWATNVLEAPAPQTTMMRTTRASSSGPRRSFGRDLHAAMKSILPGACAAVPPDLFPHPRKRVADPPRPTRDDG
jgi:hypothetical protein